MLGPRPGDRSPARPLGAGAVLPAPALPPGDGPLILITGEVPELASISQALRRGRPGVRLGALGPVAAERGHALAQVLPEVPGDPLSARRLLQQAAPAALLVLGERLPAALVAACDDLDVPSTLIARTLPPDPPAPRSLWRSTRPRNPLSRLTRLLLTDRLARTEAIRQGVAPARIEVMAAPTPVLPPPGCNRRELAALRPILRQRHVWLAAALPAAEGPTVIAAQAELLAAHHRTLLIVAPAREADAEPIAAAAEAAGLTVARREEDEEPGVDIQILVAGDSSELGLWYRLAPVTFMGGTLSGDDEAARSPLEPAALGSAILHGPNVARHAAAWTALRALSATRQVRDTPGLAAAAEALTNPDQAARLAQAAWAAATAGAEVVRRMAQSVLSDLPEPGAVQDRP